MIIEILIIIGMIIVNDYIWIRVGMIIQKNKLNVKSNGVDKL